jgi:hypothetical protein
MKNQKLSIYAIIAAILFTGTLPNASCSQSQSKAENVSLDGKKFTIIMMEPGRPETATISTASFLNGMFDDEICHIYGYTAAKYSATKNGENYNFEAKISSPTEGTETYKGIVMGDKIHGEVLWHKEGQADITYVFSNMEHTITSLDGKVYVCEVNKGDSTMTEEISFVNGNLESALCYEWGFSASPYMAWQMHEKTMWQSLYKSEKEGWMLFSGSVNGNQISGSQYWRKDGQADVVVNFSGTLKQ